MSKRRIVLVPSEWPEPERALWSKAFRERGLFEQPSMAQEWRPHTITGVAAGYGYALAWLQQNGGFGDVCDPADRWPPETLRRFQQWMGLQGRRPATIRNRLISLERGLAVVAPYSDRSTLRSAIRRLPVGQRGDLKRARLQPPSRLIELGFRLMAEAEAGADVLGRTRVDAALFRDGLQIALLAYRPIRKRNFAEIRIGTHLQPRADRLWLLFGGQETKTGAPIELPLPEPIVPWLTRYLNHFRPLLAGSRYRGDRLWVGYRFGPQTAHTIQLRIAAHTVAAFDKAMTPHHFRDGLATYIAVEDPQNVRVATTILGHRNIATTQRHYNLAAAVDASRTYNGNLKERRRIGRRRNLSGN